MKKAIVNRLARNWYRGPARVEGLDIAIDFDAGASYQPLAEAKIAIELMNVRSPAGAAAFATRFGLLSVSRDDRQRPDGREPVESFLSTAEDLRQIVALSESVQKAVLGDAESLMRLRKRFVVPMDAPMAPIQAVSKEWEEVTRTHALESRAARLKWDDRTLLIHASDLVAWGLNDGLINSNLYVYDRAQQGESVAPGQLRIGALANTLREICYLNLAMVLSGMEEVRTCPNCSIVFVVKDNRQKNCTPACGNRARVNKFNAKPDKGKHVKSTNRKVRGRPSDSPSVR